MLIGPVTEKAKNRRDRRAGRQRGAGLVEYLGLLLVVAMALTTGAGVASGALSEGGLVKKLQYNVCLGVAKAVGNLGIDVTGACNDLNPDERTSDAPPCITHQQNRLVSGNIDFRFIRGEITGKDQIIDFVDPVTGEESSLLILGNEGGLGLEGDTRSAAQFLHQRGLVGSGKAVLQGGYGTSYTFDSHEEAQQFLDDHRGNMFQRILGAVPGASAVEGLYQGAKDFIGGLFGGDDESDADPAPSGIVASLALQAQGNLDFQGGGLPGINGDAAGLQGRLRALGKESGQIRYNFDGSSQLLVRYEGEVGLEGGLGVSRQLTQKYPWLGNLGLTGGGTFHGAVQYRLRFDENFEPSQFEMRIERGSVIDKQAGNDDVNIGDRDGEMTVNTYTLDLSDPENLDAVADTLPWVMAGNLAGPAGPVGILATDNPLSRRLMENSIEYEQVYETEGDFGAANTPDSSRENGVKFRGFGFGLNNETARRTLVSARGIDHSQPGATWYDLANCY